MSFKKIFIGTFLSLAISLILACLLAVVVYFSDIQDRTVSTVVLGLSAISVFFGAYFLARNITGGGLLNGLVLSGVYFAVLAGISLLVNGGIAFSAGNILRLTASLLAGALGGVLGINTNKGRVAG